MSERDELRTALRLFIGAAYPVDLSIDPRGHRWSEAYLEQAFAAALDALARSGQAASGSQENARSDVQNGAVVGQPEAPTAVDALRRVYEAARSFLRYNGIDPARTSAAVDEMDAAVEAVKNIDGGDCFAPTAAPLTAQQLDALIERHVGGTELDDDGYSAMVLFATAVERAHGIGAGSPPARSGAGSEDAPNHFRDARKMVPPSPAQAAEDARDAEMCQPDGLKFDAYGEPRTRFVSVSLDGRHCVMHPSEGDTYLKDARDAGDESNYTVRDVWLSEREFEDLGEFDGF